MKMHYAVMLGILHTVPWAIAQTIDTSNFELRSFGEGGQLKMVYDARQRPQCLYLDGKVHLVFNAGADEGATGKSKTQPMAINYHVASKTFSDAVVLGEKSSDHHDGPVIWADMQEHLHVFFGWHHDLGKHLVSREPCRIGSGTADWRRAPAPAPKMSYPWMSRIHDNKQLVFYRTDGHYSSWTYRITSDDGNTWDGPEHDVTDLDIHRGMDTDWSIYTSKAVSKDGNFLHLGFIAYDDYRRPRSPEELVSGNLQKNRQYNPLYKERVSYKYNLYYAKTREIPGQKKATSPRTNLSTRDGGITISNRSRGPMAPWLMACFFSMAGNTGMILGPKRFC